MARIIVRKPASGELQDKAEHFGMAIAHNEHANALKRTGGRRSEFTDQVTQHLSASDAHLREAFKKNTSSDIGGIFSTKDSAVTPPTKRIFN